MKIFLRLALLAVLVAAGIWLWTVLFPGPEKIIRRRVDAIARTASFNANESPLAIAAGAQKFAGFFSSEVTVNLDVPGHFQHTFNGRDEIMQAVLGARSSISGLKVKFPDVTVTINPDRQSALADLDVEAQVGGEKDSFVFEIKFTFQKTDGQWLITRVETIRPFS